MSTTSVDCESDIHEPSRLFSSTSDIVDYQASPILNDNEKNTSNEDKESKKENNVLNLFSDDSDSFESIQEEISRNDCFIDNKTKILERKLSTSELVQKQLPKIEPLYEKQLGIEAVNDIQPEIKSSNEILLNIEPVHYTQVKDSDFKLDENKSKSTSKNTKLSKNLNSLFDDDKDDIFYKSDKNKNHSSNIFDSDDELEFNQKFTKKNLDKTKSIFGDDSDEDLFSTPSKSPASNLQSLNQIG